MRILLLGYMSSGKTSLGKLLAKKLGLRFVDTDLLLEEKYGLRIPGIFSQYGEAEFRKSEDQIISRLKDSDNIVYALGGGSACSEKNIANILSSGIAVYLCVPPDELVGRILLNSQERPLIQGMGKNELSAFVKRHLAARETYYLQAHIRMDWEQNNPETMTEILAQRIKEHISI